MIHWCSQNKASRKKRSWTIETSQKSTSGKNPSAFFAPKIDDARSGSLRILNFVVSALRSRPDEKKAKPWTFFYPVEKWQSSTNLKKRHLVITMQKPVLESRKAWKQKWIFLALRAKIFWFANTDCKDSFETSNLQDAEFKNAQISTLRFGRLPGNPYSRLFEKNKMVQINSVFEFSAVAKA